MTLEEVTEMIESNNARIKRLEIIIEQLKDEIYKKRYSVGGGEISTQDT